MGIFFAKDLQLLYRVQSKGTYLDRSGHTAGKSHEHSGNPLRTSNAHRTPTPSSRALPSFLGSMRSRRDFRLLSIDVTTFFNGVAITVPYCHIGLQERPASWPGLRI